MFQNLGYEKYSLVGWSDGAITALIMAAAYPEVIDKIVVLAGNAYVTSKDIKLYEGKTG